ncbi:hypothetical protein [Nocardia sp. CA-145437]|uniref:hypothetical protein n=1 Tax=Nocardia sp. CA-145437 TaxID=3239980 RepID=UPI003D96A2A3
MRIRSTKPEFWRSETIAALDWDARLILKGIEAYVDDNGVGKDSVVLICADVFPHDLARDPDTLARVSRGLQALCDAQIIARYTMGGERLLYVRKWKSLQRVDRPNKGRHPRPDGTLEYADDVDESVCAGLGATESGPAADSRDPREPVATPSRAPRDTPLTGTEEQGNRGTEETPSPHARTSLALVPAKASGGSAQIVQRLNATARSGPAHAIAVAFSDSLPTPLEGRLLAKVGVEIDKCLAAGIPPPAIAEGLRAWTDSDSWSPTQIPNFVHKANSRGRSRGRSKPTERAVDAAAAAEELLREVKTLGYRSQ